MKRRGISIVYSMGMGKPRQERETYRTYEGVDKLTASMW